MPQLFAPIISNFRSPTMKIFSPGASPMRRSTSRITSVLSVIVPSRFAPTTWVKRPSTPCWRRMISVKYSGFEVATQSFAPAARSLASISFMPGSMWFS